MNGVRILAAALLTAATAAPGVSVAADTIARNGTTSAVSSPLPIEGRLPPLNAATEWINSPPLTPQQLRGKVVLVAFWTYTCINWLRTAPYIRAWAQKYGDDGLVVIGVHTPEFSFEGDAARVRRAVRDTRIAFPVATDTNYEIWRAFDNHYWPALYFVDSRGQIRHHHFGEGDEVRSEQVLALLLHEAGRPRIASGRVSIRAEGVEAAADWSSLQSSENYLGYDRTRAFSSPGGAVPDRPHVYAAPRSLRVDQWAAQGVWTMQRQSALLVRPNGRLVYGFHARDVHLVMGPATRGATVRFRVTIDGRPPGAAHGIDVDDRGNGAVTEHRLYQLIRQSSPIENRHFEIHFLDPGADVYAFTFG